LFLQVNAKGDGPPIVLIHGALLDSRFWEPQLAAFSASGYRAIALGLEGFWPDTFDPGRFSAERHVRAISTFIGDYGRPVHLVGHSRGGRLALAVAAQLPERIASLVLVEAGGARSPGFFTAAPVAQHPGPQIDGMTLLDEGDVEGALRNYIDTGQGEGAWDRSPALFKSLARDNVRTLYGMAADKTHPLSRDVALKVTAPTLLIEGTASPQTFARINDVLEETIDDTLRIRFEAGDHFLMLRAPARFNAAVTDFVARHEHTVKS
jgi:pimeloyl-ACP methyl ester carboxylesterase